VNTNINGKMAVNEKLFPDLVPTGYRITSPPDPNYNCIAYAAGAADQWWWPDPDGYDYWPPGVPRVRTLPAFVQAFATAGFTPCPDGTFESGWEKVAIYATDDGPSHAARQLTNGRWTSKLGPDDDIEHSLEGLRSNAYGSVVQFLRRPAA
jgi:hypothetical protein